MLVHRACQYKPWGRRSASSWRTKEYSPTSLGVQGGSRLIRQEAQPFRPYSRFHRTLARYRRSPKIWLALTAANFKAAAWALPRLMPPLHFCTTARTEFHYISVM